MFYLHVVKLLNLIFYLSRNDSHCLPDLAWTCQSHELISDELPPDILAHSHHLSSTST